MTLKKGSSCKHYKLLILIRIWTPCKLLNFGQRLKALKYRKCCILEGHAIKFIPFEDHFNTLLTLKKGSSCKSFLGLKNHEKMDFMQIIESRMITPNYKVQRPLCFKGHVMKFIHFENNLKKLEKMSSCKHL